MTLTSPPNPSAGQDRRRLLPLALIGLAFVFIVPSLGLTGLLFDGTAIGPRIGREIVWIGFAAIILVWVTRVERLPLSSIGLIRPTWGTLGWGLAATLLTLVTLMLSFALIIPALGLQQNMAATGAIVQVPLWLLILTPFVAGITEEILYRGYAIERLTLLTGKAWLAALIAGGAFMLVHLHWGTAQLIVVGFATIIFVSLYLWRRDLPCVMIAHVLADLVGFALARAQM